jgi:hypothetical protein
LEYDFSNQEIVITDESGDSDQKGLRLDWRVKTQMDFCDCGSIRVNGNCTNKKCQKHTKSLVEPVTFHQMDYIKTLAESLGEDTDHIDFEYLSKKEASRLINEYKDRMDIEEE